MRDTGHRDDTHPSPTHTTTAPTGDEIRRARERAGLSRDQLALRVGASVKSVQRLEDGEGGGRARAKIEHYLGLGDDAAMSVLAASDEELARELLRRLRDRAPQPSPHEGRAAHTDREDGPPV